MAVKKGVLGQGTELWMLHGSTPTLTKLSCVQTFVWGDDSTTEVASTCLEDTVATTEDGILTPGAGSLGINTDPKNASHLVALDAAQDRERVEFFMGWSDGTGAPTLTGSDVTLPTTRSWSRAEATLRKNPVVVAPDSLNNHTIPFKRQTEVTETWKVTP